MLLNVGCKCGFAEYEGQYNISELWLQFKPLCTSLSRLVVLTSCRCKPVELSEFETGWGSVGVQPVEMKIERLCSRRLSVQTLTAASQRGSSFASCRQLRAKRLGFASDYSVQSNGYQPRWLLLQSAPINWILIGPSRTSASSMWGMNHRGWPAWEAKHRYHLQPETLTTV